MQPASSRDSHYAAATWLQPPTPQESVYQGNHKAVTRHAHKYEHKKTTYMIEDAPRAGSGGSGAPSGWTAQQQRCG